MKNLKHNTVVVREDFVRSLMVLKDFNAEFFLNDGSSFIGKFQHYNPETGEFYVIRQNDKISIVNSKNCLKIDFI